MLFGTTNSFRYSVAEYTPSPSAINGEPNELGECAAEVHFPVWICGRGVSGERFKLETTLESLSASRLQVRLAQCVEPNAKLFVLVRLREGESRAQGPYVALRGRVQHSEPRSDGLFDVRVEFTRHWFIYTDSDN
jgi:hypothetical protein